MSVFEKEVKRTLKDMGVAPNVRGYEYLTHALCMVLEQHDKVHKITQCIYPDVAAKCNTTPGRVERACRHAIEISFAIVPHEKIQEVFGNTVGNYRPAVSLYLAAVAEYIADGGTENA